MRISSHAERPERGERGAALLEASIGLALLTLIAGAGLTAFSAATQATNAAETTLANLADAETALELASAPEVLRRTTSEAEVELSGENWRVIATTYAIDGAREADPALHLVRLIAEAGQGAEAVRLETLRSVSR